MWQKRGGYSAANLDPTLGESIAETMSLCGVSCIPADNSRIIGWQRIHEALEDSPDGKPYLQIFNNCRMLIKHLPQLAYNENKPEDAATEPHEITDTCLSGDMIINTVDGNFAIKELIGKTGNVYCYDEENKCIDVQKYFDVRKTRENVDVFEIEMQDGRKIIATIDHPVLTQDGFKLVFDLTEDDYIIDVFA